MTGYRRPDSDIIASELSRALQQQVSAGLRGLFESLRDGMTGKGGGINIVVNNNAPVQVSAQENSGAFGQKELEIRIDQMVANSLTQGPQTTGILRSLFGLAPGLIGR